MVLETSIVSSLIFLWVYNLTPRITHKFLVEEKQKKRKEERRPMNSSSNSYEYNLMSAEKRSLQCSTAIAAIRLLLMSRELQQAREAGKSNHLTFCHDPTQNAPLEDCLILLSYNCFNLKFIYQFSVVSKLKYIY